MSNIQKPDPDQLSAALQALRSGGVIAYPTEAVWGLGCDPQNQNAFNRLLLLKRRPLEKGVILVASDMDQLGSLLSGLDSSQRKRLSESHAIPTTWLIPADASVPSWISGQHATVAVRISTHPVVSALCRSFGGTIVSTSANRAGMEPARTYRDAHNIFSTEVDAYVVGETGGADKPSRIIDLLSGQQLR